MPTAERLYRKRAENEEEAKKFKDCLISSASTVF
jgi:hypothetical protein